MRPVLLAAALLCACATPVRADAMPDWLEGAWLSCAGGVEVSEIWTGAGSGVLVGVNLTRARSAQFEFLRIGPGAGAGRVSFFGSPGGAPPVEFPMRVHDSQRVVFENPTHDFPQRVIYARDGADLTARIEGTMNGREEHMDWRFRPSTPNGHCPAR